MHLGDFYTSVPVGGKIEVTRSPLEISNLRSLAKALEEESVSLTVTLSEAEKYSGITEVTRK